MYNNSGIEYAWYNGQAAQISLGEGDDKFYAHGNGAFVVNADSGNNIIDASGSTANGSIINGGSGFDTITGGQGDDTLTGGRGNDYFAGGGGHNIIKSGGGSDTLAVASAAEDNVIVFDKYLWQMLISLLKMNLLK